MPFTVFTQEPIEQNRPIEALMEHPEPRYVPNPLEPLKNVFLFITFLPSKQVFLPAI